MDKQLAKSSSFTRARKCMALSLLSFAPSFCRRRPKRTFSNTVNREEGRFLEDDEFFRLLLLGPGRIEPDLAVVGQFQPGD